MNTALSTVIPANAGTHEHGLSWMGSAAVACRFEVRGSWVPAFAGMTGFWLGAGHAR